MEPTFWEILRFYLDQIPLLILWLILIILLLGTCELGFPLGLRLRGDDPSDKFPMESSAASIILGLQAFILAFAFGMSANRYNELQNIQREDTEAIEEVYLLSDFLSEKDAVEVRALVLDYHALRLQAIESRELKQIRSAVARSEEIHNELWRIAVRVRKEENNSVLNQFVSAVRQMMDTHTKRVSKALYTRLPPIIWLTLFGLLILASVLLGTTAGLHNRRSRTAAAIIILSFSSVFVMIVDLDRPFRSLFTTSGDPAAYKLLDQMEAEKIVSE